MGVLSSLYLCFLNLLIFSSCFTKRMTVETTSTGPKFGEGETQTTIILFGSLGDLAKRYLWPGLYNLAVSREELKNKSDSLRIFATGRTPKEKGSDILRGILDAKICTVKTSEENRGTKSCEKNAIKFSEVCSYHTTKTENDYELFSYTIAAELQQRNMVERSRIVYLSVPPFAYASIVKFIDMYLRPKTSSVKLKIVFEKPFGQDEASARDLGKQILKYFKEEQIYRVDHYLGKQAVDEILKFRINNHKKLDAIWNHHFIESLEIVMKETNDCKGRTEFYDKYGVVLDVMQNHLTEILARLLMRTSHKFVSNNQFDELKLKTLKDISSPNIDMVTAGQYIGYQRHVMEDRNETVLNKSLTATFAAVAMTTKQSGWEHVPILIVSGKRLNEKSTYVKINFKASPSFNVFGAEGGDENSKDHSFLKFFIHSSRYGGPAIEIHNGLDNLQLEFSPSWIKMPSYDGFSVLKPKKVIDAYSFLIDKIYEGDRSYFVQFESLIESWRIWDPVQLTIKSGKVPLMPYDAKRNPQLAFKYDPVAMKLIWENSAKHATDADAFSAGYGFEFSSVNQETFLGSKMIKDDLQYLIQKLASVIIESVTLAAVNNEMYHLALPGGNSITPLLVQLCEKKNSINVQHLHIWIVDERCVPFNNTNSNFKLLNDNFLKCLQIPYANIHPMPVGFGKLLCQEQNLQNYNEEVKAWLPLMELDMVILGLGADGHVASLFPGDSQSLHSNEALVINDNGPTENIPRRISMTFKLINAAKRISVIAAGKRKSKIINLLKRTGNSKISLPVLMLKQDYESVTWFIDEEAYNP